jgi:hypothetical protein
LRIKEQETHLIFHEHDDDDDDDDDNVTDVLMPRTLLMNMVVEWLQYGYELLHLIQHSNS